MSQAIAADAASEGGGDNEKHEENVPAITVAQDDDNDSDASGDSSSYASTDFRDDDDTGLFIRSTISQDDTISEGSKKRGLLSRLNEQFDSVLLQLNSSNNVPPQHNPPVQVVQPPPPLLRPPPRFPPNAGRPYRYGPPGPHGPPGPPRPPGMLPPGVLPPAGWRTPTRYPHFKVTKQSRWRQRLQASQKTEGLSEPIETRASSSGEAAPSTKSPSPSEVGSGKPTGEEEKPSVGETGAEALPNDGGLAESLSVLAQKHLKVDVLDQTKDVSNFISYLLDTIQMLESQVRYGNAGSDIDSDDESEIDDKSPAAPRFQIVHRIFCASSWHQHDGALYEDEPVARKAKSLMDPGGLSAKQQIININTFLDRYPEATFLIIKEHDCAQDDKSAAARVRPSGYTSVSSARCERLRIVSPALLKALERVAEFSIYDSNADDHLEPEMDAPYHFLFHHRLKLATLAQNDEASGAVISPLLAFLNENYEKEYLEAEDMFRRGRVNSAHLNKLFKPNQMVVSRKKVGSVEAYVLDDYVESEKQKVVLQGWSWRYNGTDLKRTFWNCRINSVPDEETNISDLVVHPVEYARAEDIKQLTDRGKKFWEMRGQVYTSYTGWDKAHNHEYVSARFMVDMATYQLMHRQSLSTVYDDPPAYDPWPVFINKREVELPPKVVMLAPSTIHGFNLHDKKWVILNIESCNPIDWNKKAFERLVLPEKTKEMIYALVDVQMSAKKMDDIITGKGNGLIVLLHGSPGTGKTLTAESVAEIAEKPLYRVTCGDIGIDAQAVEKYLETVLYLGKIWDCVLLLDEADVFLEERTMADLQRNSLVSVFLRILEYYEGILILTSNRVGTFDEAFKSRIQVAIHYDNLTKKSRKQIWQNFFDMIEDSADEDANMPELERRLEQLAQVEMNGRQIRNALLTARQLAKHRNERLDWEHLDQVMKTSASFNKYLRDIRGHSDDQWAREEMLR